MVDREHDLGRAEQQRAEPVFPHQRVGGGAEQPIFQSTVLSDEQIHALLPPGNYIFDRKQLAITGARIGEVGIRNTGERIEAHELDSSGNPYALRYILTGYEGVFADTRNNSELIRIDLVGTVVGDGVNTELITAMPRIDVLKLAQAVARKGIPIAVEKDKRTGKIIGMSSKTTAGLITDLTHLEGALPRFFSSSARRTLQRARAVAQFVRSNFKGEIPPNQPGRAQIK